jgi:phosphohistidine swiveling domain-containing protein
MVAFFAIAIGKRFALREQQKPKTERDLIPKWPDRSYIPSAGSYQWSRAEVAERYPDAVTPLFADLFLPAVGRAVQKMGRLMKIKKELVVVGYSVRKGYVFSNMGIGSLNILGILRGFARVRRGSLYYSLTEYPSARDRFWNQYRELDNRLKRQANDLREDYALLLRSLSLFEEWMLQQSISLFYLNFGVIYLRLIVTLHFPLKRAGVLRSLPLGLPTVSAAESELLYKLGKLIAEDDVHWEDLQGEAKELAEQLLFSLGDQSSSYDFTEKIWRHQPGLILDMARSMAKAEESPHDQLARLSQQRLSAESRLSQRLKILHPFSGKRLASDMIQMSHSLYALKEERQKQMAAGWALVKRSTLRLGESFHKIETLRSPEDMHYLTANELSGLVHSQTEDRHFLSDLGDRENVAAIVRVRRNELRLLRSVDVPEQEQDEVLEMPWKKSESTTTGLSGKHTLPGQATAPANVIKTQEDFPKMRPGDILVARATNPHWDTLFSMARGIIVERGGPQSHAMLKASEYGIPAIIGLPHATEYIKDGDLVHLDGDNNRVTWERANA